MCELYVGQMRNTTGREVQLQAQLTRQLPAKVSSRQRNFRRRLQIWFEHNRILLLSSNIACIATLRFKLNSNVIVLRCDGLQKEKLKITEQQLAKEKEEKESANILVSKLLH